MLIRVDLSEIFMETVDVVALYFASLSYNSTDPHRRKYRERETDRQRDEKRRMMQAADSSAL